MSLRDRCVYVLLIFSIVLIPCKTLKAKSRSDSPAKPAAVIGACLPLTGNASVGQVQRQALLVAQRIKPLVADEPVELIIKDTQGTAFGTRNAVRSALEDHHVTAFIGGTTTDEAAAMLDVVGREHKRKANLIPLVVTTADGPFSDASIKPWRISAPLMVKARAAAGFAVDKLKATRAGILVDPADADSVRLASIFSSAMIAKGGVVAEIAYIGKSEDTFRIALAVLANKKVDVIFLPGERRAPQVIVFSRDQGVKTPFLLADVTQENGFIKAVGASKDVYVVTDYHPAFALGDYARRFLDLYRQQYGEPDTIAALTADAYFLLCDALPFWRTGKGRHPQVPSSAFKQKGYLSGSLDVTGDGEILRNVYVSVVHASRLKCLEALKP